MNKNKNKSGNHVSKRETTLGSSQNKSLIKLGKIFNRTLSPDETDNLWKPIIDKDENFDLTLKHIEFFFSFHPDRKSSPVKWDIISKVQDSLPFEDAIKYLTSFTCIGQKAFFASMQSYYKFGEIRDTYVYENFINTAQHSIAILNMAIEIIQRRSITQAMDIERLVELAGKGGFGKKSASEILYTEYQTLDSNYERREFLENLITQLSPHNKSEFKELLYRFAAILIEVNKEIEKEAILSSLNPKQNGSSHFSKLSVFLKLYKITSADEKLIRKEIVQIKECLELKTNDTEKSSFIKFLLEQHGGEALNTSKVIVEWLKVEFNEISKLPEDTVAPKNKKDNHSHSNKKHEKIRWELSEAGLAYWFKLLYEERAISQSTYDKRFIFMETFFENKDGKSFKRRQSLQAETNSRNNNNPKHKAKPREAPQLEKLATEWVKKFNEIPEN